MSRRNDESGGVTSSPMYQLLRRNFGVIAFLFVSALLMLAVFFYFDPESSDPATVTPTNYLESPVIVEEPAPTSPSDPESVSTPTEQPIPETPSNLVGIIAGHRGYDSGTVCEDGLTEVQITSELAEKIALLLRAEGLDVETLNEFDPRIDEYEAAALIAIHIDSCDYINDLASGYKISGSSYTDSSGLFTCVQEAYGKATQLKYHPNSITPEMAGYHAFRKIDSQTPAIILEAGFLNLDREMLTDGIDVVARGIYDGIMCYVDR